MPPLPDQIQQRPGHPPELARNQARRAAIEERMKARYEALVSSGVEPSDAIERAKAEEDERSATPHR